MTAIPRRQDRPPMSAWKWVALTIAILSLLSCIAFLAVTVTYFVTGPAWKGWSYMVSVIFMGVTAALWIKMAADEMRGHR